MPDNRWPDDKTTFRVEVFEKNQWTADDWRTVGSKYEFDTFNEAVADLPEFTSVYRKLRIIRTVDTVMAEYTDGVAVE